MTPSGIEPATFRFVAQHLNHCITAVPFINQYNYKPRGVKSDDECGQAYDLHDQSKNFHVVYVSGVWLRNGMDRLRCV